MINKNTKNEFKQKHFFLKRFHFDHKWHCFHMWVLHVG